MSDIEASKRATSRATTLQVETETSAAVLATLVARKLSRQQARDRNIHRQQRRETRQQKLKKVSALSAELNKEMLIMARNDDQAAREEKRAAEIVVAERAKGPLFLKPFSIEQYDQIAQNLVGPSTLPYGVEAKNRYSTLLGLEEQFSLVDAIESHD
jgi:hypothetical protein